MPLGPGSRLDAYELLQPLGAGGMGEVWLATELRLGRKLALKLLPSDLTRDPARVSRFEQEARAASALSHPNVCTILALGETPDGQHYIAMEYVDGETLRKRIAGGRHSIREAVDIAVQIASALVAAHAAGIVHRDIKPENVIVRPDGFVKVLDFGLAKLAPAASSAVESTPTAFCTDAGTVVGTVAYMSPEQARGQQVDFRTDIWSAGVVLYEMVAGRSPFAGSSSSDALAAILDREPAPLARFEPDVPAELQRIVTKALRKDRSHRYQSSQDLLLDLHELQDDVHAQARAGSSPSATRGVAEQSVLAAQPPAARSKPAIVIAALTVVLLMGAAAALWWWTRETTTGLAALEVVPLTSDAGQEESPSFSPDGSQVAYSWDGERQDNRDIYVKLIGAPTPLRLTNDPADDLDPVFSPDGRSIGFVRVSKERWTYVITPAIGGGERKVAELPQQVVESGSPYGSHWSSAWMPDGRSIVLSGLRLLSLETGELRAMTTEAGAVVSGWYPAVAPNGRTMAFARPSGLAAFGLYAIALADDGRLRGEPRLLSLVQGDLWGLSWTADSRHLVFASGRLTGTSGMAKTLWRMPATEGAEPRPVSVGDDATAPTIPSRGDRLAFVRNTFVANLWLAMVAEAGGVAGPSSRFAPSTRSDWNPHYSPDGSRVAFESTRTGESAVWVSAADGSNLMEVFSRAGRHSGSPRWAPDGGRIAFDSTAAGNFDVYAIQPGTAQPVRLTTESSDDVMPSWSPDGKWIYFASNRSGRREVWKVPAAGGAAVQVTRNGGARAYPSADGTQIYYTKDDGDAALWSMPVAGGEEREVLPSVIYRNFAVLAEGIYFIPRPGSDGRSGVHYLDFSTGAVHQVLRLEGRPSLGLTVSPDRRRILVAQTDQVGRDLMLVNGFR
jgi:eukaryotic-like serine/threonine-protein kinase